MRDPKNQEPWEDPDLEKTYIISRKKEKDS